MRHISQWLNQITTIQTNENRQIEVRVLNHQQDPAILSDWARHFRQHYCPDQIIDDLREGTGLSRKDFLDQMIFPDRHTILGPPIRSGDFGELLVADYLEYSMNYWVPRFRMESKAVRDESVKGSDVIGFRFVNRDYSENPSDELVIYECKAGLSTPTHPPVDFNKLQVAVNDSAKDSLRKAEALNFLKRKLHERNDQNWNLVQRFQDSEDRPYIEINGAAAILSTATFDQMIANLPRTIGNSHPNQTRLRLLVIHGDNLMDFVHALYGRAANEA